MRGRAGWLRVTGFVLALSAGRPALAQVTQTDASKTPLPQPVPNAELNLVNSSYAWNANTVVLRDQQGNSLNPEGRYGDVYAPPAYPQFVTGDAINLSGLFKWRKETLNPVLDAKTGPGHLSAKCGFSAELVLLGGNCQAQFGWYNVLDPESKTPPTAAEIYPLIVAPAKALQCVEGDGKTPKTDGFCPLAWDNRHPYDLSILRWVPQAFSSGDLSQDPRYQGGDVGFALIGDPQKCPQNKYSMYEHNQRNAAGTPWVTTLVYQSTVDPNGFYLAFEDLPMSPADWKRSGTSASGGADGDFNDYVVYVSRTSCPGEVDDPCASVVCTGDALCLKGRCVSPPTGAGGSAGESGDPSGGTSSLGAAGTGMADAGEESAAPTASAGAAGEDDGATSTAGTDAGGGTDGVVAAPSEKSSSCGYAALPSGQSPRTWPVLGLLFGLAFVCRRRRARSTPELDRSGANARQ
jgi:hypothetical protein